MDGIIPTNPSVGFPIRLLSVFFLITAIFRNNAAFLVFFNERREWLILDQRLVDAVRELQLQIPIDQIDWQRLCQHFLTNFTTLPFYLNQGIQEIEWCNVIFLKRNLRIDLKDGRQVIAKYIENFGEMWCEHTKKNEHHIRCQIRGTDEVVIIPISAILTHILSNNDLYQYDENLASEACKAKMRKRGEIVSFPQIQRNYPIFSEVSMKVLFLLCKRFGIALEFTYRFNLIVRRLVCLGDQSIYSPPELAEEDQEAFMAFMERYMNQFVGRVIVSNTIRFQQSNLPDKLRGLFEIYCHRSQNYSPTQADVDSFLSKSDEFFVKFAVTILENAFALPDTYWTQPEVGVLTKQKKNYPMCHFLFPMPKDFPKDIFE